MPDPQASKPDTRLRTFTLVGDFFAIIVFQFVGFPSGRYRIYLYCAECLLRLIEVSSLSLDVGYLFLVGSRVILGMVFNS